jgi:Fe2+ or Zn2+ uptake regulation protein
MEKLNSERRNNHVFESERANTQAHTKERVFHHHQFAYCPNCGKWYELQWESDGSQILNKAEFQVICVGCGEFVTSM